MGKKQTFNPLSGSFDFVNSVDVGALNFKGNIGLASDFPTVAGVLNGDTYYVTTNVTDNDPTKTNTGESFTTGQYITWDGTGWSVTNASINWGSIGGILSNQSDLQTALDGKIENLSTFDTDDLTEGSTNKYLSGNEFNKVSDDSDDIVEGAVNKFLTGNEFDKITDDSDDINEGATNKFMTDAEKSKLGALTDYFRGYFIDEATLISTYPLGNAGEYALVGGGAEDTFYYWDTTGASWIDTGSTSTGDMLKAVYDKTNVNGDAFDMDNMFEGTNNKILTSTERQNIIDSFYMDNMVEGVDTKIMTAAERTAISDNTTDISTLQTNKADKSNVLELDNTDVFVPNAPYEPATKKYVDDNSVLGGTYTGTAERNIGGISDGQSFVSVSMTEMWDSLIKQEKFPTLTNPSSTFTSSITGFREVGESIDITFNSTFNRGAINPQYTAVSPYRAGLPNEYQFTGTGLTNQSKTDLTDSQTVNGYTVVINGQSWQGRVAYDEGVQPKSSYGNDYDSPLPAGNTNYITRTITGVYPYFGNTVNITTMTKQSLASHGSVITITLAAESGSDKQSIEIPTVWGNLTKLEQYNPLSSSWDTISTASFTETVITNAIQGNVVNYKKFTHNGGLIGGRQLRFTF